MKLAIAILALICLWMSSAVAQQTTITGSFVQGGLVVGKTIVGATVQFAGRTLRVSDDGVFVFGFHRDDPPSMHLAVQYPDGEAETINLTVAQRDYDIQRINGLPKKKVTPPKDVIERIQREAAAVRKARSRDTTGTEFLDGFLWPVDGKITGVYGSQRILNGKPRQPHYGIDIAAPKGTPVLAPAAGIVSFAEGDLYYSGGTLMIDHGHGFASTFLHMETLAVQVGQHVNQGDPIGTVGSTGRSTGPHLDWRVNWFEKRLDAQLLDFIQK